MKKLIIALFLATVSCTTEQRDEPTAPVEKVYTTAEVAGTWKATHTYYFDSESWLDTKSENRSITFTETGFSTSNMPMHFNNWTYTGTYTMNDVKYATSQQTNEAALTFVFKFTDPKNAEITFWNGLNKKYRFKIVKQ